MSGFRGGAAGCGPGERAGFTRARHPSLRRPGRPGAKRTCGGLCSRSNGRPADAHAQRRLTSVQRRPAHAEERARQAGAGTYAEGVAACFGALHALLGTRGAWEKLMAWTPFRTWAEAARGGVVADVEGALAAERARRQVPARSAPSAGMAR